MTYTIRDVEAWLETLAAGTLSLLVDNRTIARDALGLLGAQAIEIEGDQLSPNFTLSELTYSDTANAEGIENTPGEAEIDELEQLAQVTLEGIRSLLGDRAMTITSGFRCAELNAAIGGASNSAHVAGAAADFIVAGMTPLEVCRAIEPHLEKLEIDQLIHENESWIHVGRSPGGGDPRCECLTIDNGKTVTGIV